jgi:Raf kinase inhibitor-like YbhB/YbcL family protein
MHSPQSRTWFVLRPRVLAATIVLTALVAGCAPEDFASPDVSTIVLNDKPKKEERSMAIKMTSTAFADGQPVPTRHTCDGDDLSPSLAWTGIPDGTKSIALIADDPDAPAGTWVHWVLYNLPATATELPEGVAKTEALDNGAAQGTNDFKRIGYGGPCPPPGSPHRYFFKLYALESRLELAPGATKQQLLEALDGHVIAEGQLMGTYKRKK